MATALADPAAPVRVTFVGQSMNFSPAAPGDIPMMTCRPLELPWQTIAINGTGWSSLMANSSYMANVAAQPRNQAGTLDIAVMNGGQSDIINDGDTPAQAYADAVAFAAELRSYGFDLILGVTFADVNPNAYSGTDWADTVALYAADASGAFDAIARADLVLTDCFDTSLYIGPDIDPILPYIHLNTAGGKIMADCIRPVLSSLT